MDWNRVNYLNYGDSLNTLLTLCYSFQDEFYMKDDVVWELKRIGKTNKYLEDIIKTYGGRKTKRIDLKAFQDDIVQSVNIKKKFTEFGCRGFSYASHESADICGRNLREDINFRIALMPDEKLYYPPRIRKYLRRVFFNHYRLDMFPSICFALGKIEGEICFVFIMQSDLAYRMPSFIRDHFRGWRNILIKSIISSVNPSCMRIYLPNAHDVRKCCHPSRKPKSTPKSWLMIYDRTARDFAFSIEKLQKSVNIQIYKDLDPVFANKFYKLDLKC